MSRTGEGTADPCQEGWGRAGDPRVTGGTSVLEAWSESSGTTGQLLSLVPTPSRPPPRPPPRPLQWVLLPPLDEPSHPLLLPPTSMPLLRLSSDLASDFTEKITIQKQPPPPAPSNQLACCPCSKSHLPFCSGVAVSSLTALAQKVWHILSVELKLVFLLSHSNQHTKSSNIRSFN